MISSKCAKIVGIFQNLCNLKSCYNCTNRLITLEFQVKCSRKPPPAPVPPNTTSTALNTILLPSYVATLICPPSIWENACVNGMKSSVELSNLSVYLKFNKVFVEGTGTYPLWPLQATIGDSSRHINHNAYSGYTHIWIWTSFLESLVQDFIDIPVECKELCYDYIIGPALEFSVVALGLAKLVDNGKFSLYSFLVVGSFGYTIYGYGVVLLKVLIDMHSMERIISFLAIL
ncbi:hypothetical protein QL285_057409 [Trifolium repens]|nr:hypothetical protein QL285_057409 [Trifolium repens]